MRKLLIGIFMFAMILVTSFSFAGTTEDALDSLKKLQAKCQTGISFRDYSPALGDARFYVNKFIQSDESKNNYELTANISNAIDAYQFAQEVWNMKFTYNSPRDFVYIANDDGKLLLDAIHKIFKNRDPSDYEGKIISTLGKDKALFLMGVVQLAWEGADESIKRADFIIREKPQKSKKKK